MSSTFVPSEIESSEETTEFELLSAASTRGVELLNRNVFLVKEHVGLFRASSNYDIYDPETGEVILHCREPNLGLLTKLLRFTDYKRMMPFNVHITTPSGEPVLRISRGISLFLSNVRVFDARETFIGGFKQKFFSIGGKFAVVDSQEEVVCELKGKWSGWNFQFHANGHELARVTKEW
jgi:hypothetical protein